MQDNFEHIVSTVSPSEILHRAAARVDARLDQGLAELGLTSRQYLLLKCVAAHDGITQVGLSDMSGIDRSTMTDMVGRMVNRGLLVREKKATDARAYNVRITEPGLQQLRQAEPFVRKIDAGLIDMMPPHLRQAFLSTLEIICDSKD